MKHVSMFILFTAFALMTNAQNLPPIFEHTPKKIVQVKKLAMFPKNTWLENLVQGNDHSLYVTNYPEGKVMKVSLDGKQEEYAKIDGKIAGIAKFGNDEFLVVGWDKAGQPTVFLIDHAKVVTVFAKMKGAMFPNGIIPFTSNAYLIADSFAGCIWLLNTADKTTRVWISDTLLARSSNKVELPAANGLKIFKNNLYVSNSQKQTFIKIPILGDKPGKPSEILHKVFIDDFCFDQLGNIYAAANVYNSILKISPNMQVTIIAGINEGAAGATAIAPGKNKEGKEVFFVSTCGGMGVPPPTGIEEGKILEIPVQ